MAERVWRITECQSTGALRVDGPSLAPDHWYIYVTESPAPDLQAQGEQPRCTCEPYNDEYIDKDCAVHGEQPRVCPSCGGSPEKPRLIMEPDGGKAQTCPLPFHSTPTGEQTVTKDAMQGGIPRLAGEQPGGSGEARAQECEGNWTGAGCSVCEPVPAGSERVLREALEKAQKVARDPDCDNVGQMVDLIATRALQDTEEEPVAAEGKAADAARAYIALTIRNCEREDATEPEQAVVEFARDVYNLLEGLRVSDTEEEKGDG